ncbi:hypothetical protein AMBLS11_08745 [Alteromonas macleodii str. 'Black Sea 11']|nr:hypothetical protein AMBLS11_08745 [Alteromonas macleodii str. 'Black Sea 11']|tara:strand:- start:648 stop:833 length:186 start_codon:yes stop_codon:yes gene_type:complete
MDFLFNVLIWVGVVIFAIFFIGFMAAAKLNKRQEESSANQRSQNAAGPVREGERPSDQNKE